MFAEYLLMSLGVAPTAAALLPLLPKSSGVFWLLLQKRGEAQKEANLYQLFAVSLQPHFVRH
jgi:hypothetical protein